MLSRIRFSLTIIFIMKAPQVRQGTMQTIIKPKLISFSMFLVTIKQELSTSHLTAFAYTTDIFIQVNTFLICNTLRNWRKNY